MVFFLDACASPIFPPFSIMQLKLSKMFVMLTSPKRSISLTTLSSYTSYKIDMAFMVIFLLYLAVSFLIEIRG
ncbi:hypothetical protein J437_LFUL013381 [Ladona fulva]|uniref:Uncharacterized protein n=1 Tax=Ladona fulva TaxID=123851 RepID=A0A8K0KHH9_LADFU|nr:hypothetical protein J437_LFUL013381 [Ladona fulva]